MHITFDEQSNDELLTWDTSSRPVVNAHVTTWRRDSKSRRHVVTAQHLRKRQAWHERRLFLFTSHSFRNRQRGGVDLFMARLICIWKVTNMKSHAWEYTLDYSVRCVSASWQRAGQEVVPETTEWKRMGGNTHSDDDITLGLRRICKVSQVTSGYSRNLNEWVNEKSGRIK